MLLMKKIIKIIAFILLINFLIINNNKLTVSADFSYDVLIYVVNDNENILVDHPIFDSNNDVINFLNSYTDYIPFYIEDGSSIIIDGDFSITNDINIYLYELSNSIYKSYSSRTNFYSEGDNQSLLSTNYGDYDWTLSVFKNCEILTETDFNNIAAGSESTHIYNETEI